MKEIEDAVAAGIAVARRFGLHVDGPAWCWADVERGDLRHHAETHLASLKRAFARPVRR
jgi:hypothetical protein